MDVGAFEEPTPEVLPSIETPDVAGDDETSAERFELLSAPRGAPDDLSHLQGVGPQVIQKLNDAGIYHWWQIAAMTPEDVAKVDHDLKLSGRIDREGWVTQAREAMASV